MTNSISGLSGQALRQGSSLLREVGKNLAKYNIPQSNAIDRELKTITGGGRVLGIDTQCSRREDSKMQTVVRNNLTIASEKSVINNYFQALSSFTSIPGSKEKSLLTQQVTKFISNAGLLVENADLSLRQNFVAEGAELANSLSKISNKVSELRLEADQEMVESVFAVNRIITNLSALNKTIVKNGSIALNILDDRDRLLNELATHLDIDVNYEQNGIALVSTRNGRATLLDKNTYSQLSYNGLASKEVMLNGAKVNPVFLNRYTDDEKNLGSYEVTSSSINLISGGKIGALMELRDKQLVSSFSGIKSLTNAVVNSVNAIHNSGSSFPPKIMYKGTEKVTQGDQIKWSGGAKLSVIEKVTGHAIQGTSGAIRSMALDLEHLGDIDVGGQPTIANIIEELNQLSHSLSTNRLSMGAILDNNGAQVLNNYLLNNIQMVGRSDIKDGAFTFDFDIDGNQYFGSDVKIIGITGLGGAFQNAQLPDKFRVEIGQRSRINRSITVKDIPNILGPQNIDVKFQVMGDNGTVQEGTARFTIDLTNSEMTNKRVYGTVPFPHPPGILPNSMQALVVPTSSSLFTAKLVDESGSVINKSDTTTKGYLVIEVNNKNQALVIDDDSSKGQLINSSAMLKGIQKGFNHLFGSNNFFEVNEITGAVKVRDDIKADVNNLSGGIIGVDGGALTTVKKGLTKTTATMQFAGAIGNNSTVTINGKTFTFGGGPNALVDLAYQINHDVVLSNIITAGVNNLHGGAGDTITLAAQQAGTTANFFQARWNINGGGTIDFNATGAAVNNLAGINLGNNAGIVPGTTLGIDQDIQVIKNELRIGIGSTKIFERLKNLENAKYSIEDNLLVPTATSTTIQGYTSMISAALSNQILTAKADSDISQKTVEGLDRVYKEKVGISMEEQYSKASEIVSYLQINAMMVKLMQRTMDNLMEVLK